MKRATKLQLTTTTILSRVYLATKKKLTQQFSISKLTYFLIYISSSPNQTFLHQKNAKNLEHSQLFHSGLEKIYENIWVSELADNWAFLIIALFSFNQSYFLGFMTISLDSGKNKGYQFALSNSIKKTEIGK